MAAPVPAALAFEYPDATADRPHYVSYATARTVADDGLFEVWNGPTNSSRVFRVNKDGQLQLQDGAVGAPTLAPEEDKDTGVYFVTATPEVAVAVAGSKVFSVVAAGVAVTGTLSSSGAATLASLTVAGGGSLTGTWSNLGTVTTVDINGGTIDGVVIGGATPAAGTFTTLSSTGGAFNGTVGATTPAAGTFTSLSSTSGALNGTVGGTTPAAGTFTTLTATGGGSLTGTWSNLGTVTTVDINGGTADGVVIGGATPAAATFTTLNATGGGSLTGTWSNLGVVTTVDINGGTIDGAIIGGASPAAGTFTALTASSTVNFTGNVNVGGAGGAIGFYEDASGAVKPTLTGSKGGNAALEELLVYLHDAGMITNNTV